MQYIDALFNSTLEIKKSKFITYIVPFTLFDETMNHLKNEHPKARHFVYAYRYLNEFEQVVENSSDDGEPKGTSGRPALSVLAGADFINTAVIVVRYFGGIRLGTGGLVKAYSDAVNLVIKSSDIKKFVKLEYRELTVTYSELSKLEYILLKHNIKITNKTFTDTIGLNLEATKEQFRTLLSELSFDNILRKIV